MNRTKRTILGVGFLLLWGAVGLRAQEQTNIVPRADTVLRAACQYLSELGQFSIRAELWRERVIESGQKVQFTRAMEMEMKRPDRLHAEIHAPLSDRGFWYDGKALSILDRKHNVFSTAPMPGNMDAALDLAHQKYGMDIPLIDLAVSDPYKNATARVQQGRYFGLASVLGYECHHLAFTQENIDWQMWVQTGPRPLIRKLVITHKNDEGAPEFTALLTEWNLTEPIASSDFVFEAPDGVSQVEMRLPDASKDSGSRKAGASAEPAH